MNTGEGKSTSSYAYTATASKISCYYSGKWPQNQCGEFRMPVISQTSYSRTRKGADKNNKIIRERLLCKETPNRWRLAGLGRGHGQIRQDMRKLCKITGHGERHWGMIHPLLWQDTGNRVLPLKASGGELNTSNKEVVLATTLKNSYTLCHGKLYKAKYEQVKNGSQRPGPSAPTKRAIQMRCLLRACYSHCVFMCRDGTWAAFLCLSCYRPLSEPGYFVKCIFKNCYPASN